MLRSGEINFLTDFNGDPKVVQDAAAADGDLEIVATVEMGFRYIGFNLRRPPFDGPAFRNALSAAVDLVLWRDTGRVIRSQVLSLRSRGYVEAARVVGSPPCRCPMSTKATPPCPSDAAHRIRATRRQAACSATAAQRPMPAAPSRSRN